MVYESLGYESNFAQIYFIVGNQGPTLLYLFLIFYIGSENLLLALKILRPNVQERTPGYMEVWGMYLTSHKYILSLDFRANVFLFIFIYFYKIIYLRTNIELIYLF